MIAVNRILRWIRDEIIIIHWGPVDDLAQGPNVLMIKRYWHYSLMIRPRPFWLRFHIWWTRRALIRDYRESTLNKRPKIWIIPPTLEIGTFKIDRAYPTQHTVYDTGEKV